MASLHRERRGLPSEKRRIKRDNPNEQRRIMAGSHQPAWQYQKHPRSPADRPSRAGMSFRKKGRISRRRLRNRPGHPAHLWTGRGDFDGRRSEGKADHPSRPLGGILQTFHGNGPSHEAWQLVLSPRRAFRAHITLAQGGRRGRSWRDRERWPNDPCFAGTWRTFTQFVT
jgi:hypothetical protein